jgi:hypothetical protein
MYRISNNKRKYSPTPIIEVTTDANGKETEKIICVFTLSKKEGDLLAEQFIKLLNSVNI